MWAVADLLIPVIRLLAELIGDAPLLCPAI
jgi:hypothetical protein